MTALVVGLNHRSAPLWIRERVAFAEWAGAAREMATRAALPEALVLSTCNRVEVYGAAVDVPEAAGRLVDALAERAAMPAGVLRPYLFVASGTDAARHLARVAAGMDSMVLGETQIVAQLKRAVADARRDGVLGRVLHRLVSTAFAAGKRARPQLPASSGAQSVAEAAVRALGGVAALADRSVVVVGAGETAADLLRSLAGARPRRLVIVNRTLRRALPLAARHGAAVASWEALGVVVADADVVFACTASATPVVLAEHLAGAPARARTFADLGVPRNVAPAVADVPGVRLIDVDMLGGWRQALGPARADVVEPRHAAAEAVVSRWVARFASWERTESVLATITELRDGADAVREREVARALARLGALGDRERAVVCELAARLVNKLLHHPLSTLSGDADAPALAEPARRLFGLDGARLGNIAGAPSAVPEAAADVAALTAEA